MSTELDKEIETNVISILTEAINNRNGEFFTDTVSLITFIAIICSNAANLEQVDYKKLPLDEQVNIAMVIIPNVYHELKEANLIHPNFLHEVESLMDDIDELRNKVKTAIATYDLTAQIVGLPSFNDVSKAGITAIKASGIKIPKVNLKKIKIKL